MASTTISSRMQQDHKLTDAAAAAEIPIPIQNRGHLPNGRSLFGATLTAGAGQPSHSNVTVRQPYNTLQNSTETKKTTTSIFSISFRKLHLNPDHTEPLKPAGRCRHKPLAGTGTFHVPPRVYQNQKITS